MAIVYRHRRLDTNEVFYIGYSKNDNLKRAYSKHHRTVYWERIVEKVGYEVDILAQGISENDAKELEVFLISLYGRQDLKSGILINMSDGGDGNVNYRPSEEVKKAHSERMKGENNPFYGKKHSEEVLKRISETRNHSKGEDHHMFGYKHSEENLKKMRGNRPSVSGCNNPRAQKVIDTITLEIFCSIDLAAKYYKVSANNLRRYLNGTRKNTTTAILLKNFKIPS